ncbi:MAG: hypothetical protein LBG92_03490, partial [Prevotellaceae bacterium]|nr:hypothetical protein [Prevotellaceae bacterium]
MRTKIFSIFAASVLLAVSCKSKQGANSGSSQEYNPYVVAFTSGNVSVKSSIAVQLYEETAYDPDDEVRDKLFDISPSVSGKIRMLDKKTFVFVPDENLKINQKYTVTFNVGKAVEKVEKQHSKFVFEFSTIKPSFYMARDGLKLYSETLPHLYKLVREVHLSDYADPAAVEKMLTVKLNEKAQSVKWEHDGNKHTFTVDSINALETPSEILLNLDAKPVGGDLKDEEKIRVPSKFEFDILGVGMSEEDKDQVIICRFSSPIESKQNLKGIISLENARFTYRIVLNTIMIYPSEKLTGNVTLTIHESLKSANGGNFGKNYEETLTFESINPEVKFVGKGTILPSTNEGTILPFQAVSLKSVTVKIIKIYENNILQFFQVNNLSGSTELKRAGRLIAVKTIRLDENRTEKELKRWNTYALDLSKFVTAEHGAIYRVELSFTKNQAVIDCNDDENPSKEYTDEELFASIEKEYDKTSQYYYYEDYGYESEFDGDYSYENSKNPCFSAYYRNKSAVKNVLASDLGIIAKMGTNNSARFIVTSIHSVSPIASVGVDVYNYQQQLIGSGTTNAEGIVDVSVSGKPFVAIAKYGNQRGYLQMQDGMSLSLSRFDVAGDAVKNGVKGFIYSERGVWRPGDSIFLTFILQDDTETIPASHPAILEITNAKGQIVNRQSKIGGVNGFYTFIYKTEETAPTGNWLATVKIGGISFQKTLKIETVKPNRLKINLNFDKKEIDTNEPITGTLSATWLHGAQVKNLNTEITMNLNSATTNFKGFESYVFDDPTKTFESTEKKFFSGKLGNDGSVSFSEKITVESATSGKLKANFITRVFEEGGDFSVDIQSREISPYKRYAGILQPKGTGFGNMLETDKNQIFNIALLDRSGSPIIGNNELKVSVYKLGWSWWWSSSNNQFANFNYSSYNTPVHEEKITVSDGRGVFSYKTGNSEYGFYLIKIADNVQPSGGGHSAGTVAYFDWPGWGGRARQGAESVMMLMFESDKESYSVGET